VASFPKEEVQEYVKRLNVVDDRFSSRYDVFHTHSKSDLKKSKMIEEDKEKIALFLSESKKELE
jgi:hypothetical protein